MTVAPSMEAATRTESVPWKRGRSPPSIPEGLGGATKRPARKPSVMMISRPTMIVSNWRCRPPPWTRRRPMEWDPEQEVKGECAADDLGEVGRGGDDFRLNPEGDAPGFGHARAE